MEGIPREVYFRGRRLERAEEHLRSIAADAGLELQHRDVIINSRRALGAAEFARERGRFDEMHHALFQAHWGGGGKLEDVEHLVRIGSSVGLEASDLRTALEEDRYADVIDENRRIASSVGINAIPAHIFGRRYLVVGAQPYEVLKQVVDRLHHPD